LKQLPRPIPMPARSFPTQSYRNSVSSEVCNRTVAGVDKQRSLRCAAALIITSCASVSLTLMIQPFFHPASPEDPSPSLGRAPDRPVPMGRLGHSRFCAAPDDDTNASFRTKSQCFLHRARNCSEWPNKLLRAARCESASEFDPSFLSRWGMGLAALAFILSLAHAREHWRQAAA
jgi:hypothetical protein